MENWKRSVAFLKEAVLKLDPEISVVDRAGLYAGCTSLLEELRTCVNRDFHGDGYALEKIGKAKWSVAAALGIDDDNGHDAGQHRAWALGELGSLESKLTQLAANKVPR